MINSEEGCMFLCDTVKIMGLRTAEYYRAKYYRAKESRG